MSFPRYPSYKDSGVEWLGAVPEHWGVSRLSHVAEVLAGHSFDAAKFDFDGFPVIRMSDFGSGKVQLIDAKRIDPLHVPERSLAKVGDVLLGLSGSISNFAVVREDDLPIAINQRVAMVRISDGCRGIVRWFLQSSEFSNQLASVLPATTIQNISMGQLRGCSLPKPPHSEQTQIVAFLDRETAKIDALVAEQQRLMELLKEKRQAVISHAVAKGLNPNAPMKPSGIEWLGDVPAHWEKTKIKRVAATFEQGWSPQCEGFPVENERQWGVLKVGCVNGGTFNPEENKALPPELEPIPSLGIALDDLLISRANTRELVGGAAVARQNYANLLLCDKLYRLRFSHGECDAEFIALYLGTAMARAQIELAATGASSSMVNIAQSTILEMELALPAFPEQQTIVTFLKIESATFDTLTTEAQHAIDLLQERRTALISAAVTGQIDVRHLSGKKPHEHR